MENQGISACTIENILKSMLTVIELNLKITKKMRKSSQDSHQRSSISFYLNKERKDSLSISNHSKSPSRQVNGVKLYNFSDMNSYRKINKPFLNEEKKNHIKQQLDLQKKALNRAKRRDLRNQNFVEYRYNPFSHEGVGHSKSQFRMQNWKEDPQEIKRHDIVTGINNIQQKNLNRQKHSASLIKLRDDAEHLSTLFKKQTLNASKSMKIFRKPSITLPKYENKPQISSRQIQKKPEMQDPQMDLDDIIEMNEEKHNPYKYKSINIFEILHNKDKYFEQAIPLEKYNFSFSHLIQKMDKYRINFARDLSKNSRRLIRKKPEGMVEDYSEFRKDIKFQDLLGVVSGRYTPEFVYQKLNKGKQIFKLDKFKESDLFYDERLKNQSSMVEIKQHSAVQIAQYKQICFKKEEIQYKKLCENRKDEINTLFSKEEYLLKSKIYDRNLHKDIKNSIDGKLQDFIASEFRYPKDLKGRDHQVLVNKESKNRNDVIKMKKILQTYFLKKESEHKLSDLKFKRS